LNDLHCLLTHKKEVDWGYNPCPLLYWRRKELRREHRSN